MGVGGRVCWVFLRRYTRQRSSCIFFSSCRLHTTPMAFVLVQRETGPGGKHNALKMTKKKEERALVLSYFSLVEFLLEYN